MSVELIVGTVKGAFVLRAEASRSRWEVEGPLFKGWRATASTRLADGRTLLGTASPVYGAAIQSSADLVEWAQVPEGPAYPQGGARRMNQIWRLVAAGDRVYAGVDEAGLFVSDDGAQSFRPVSALNDHATRASWVPGFGGLCLHSILVDPANADRMWVGISAVGVFRTDDGGASWTTCNDGVPVILEDAVHKDIGFCVHSIALDPARPDRLYRQDHRGMFRSDDAGDHWTAIESGLPSSFGFPLGRDARTGRLYAFPLEADETRVPIDGRLTAYVSDDDGDSWQPRQEGLPDHDFMAGVLRGALATDGLDPGGVYFGTTSGTVHVSRNGGDSWTTLPVTFPRILSVDAYTV